MKKFKKKPSLSQLHFDEQIFTSEDLLDQLTTHTGSTLLLGKFTQNEIRISLEKTGIIENLKNLGISEILISIEPLDNFNQILKVYTQKKEPEYLLAEVRLREVIFQPKRNAPNSKEKAGNHMLAIEWMMMQHPFKSFTTDYLPLPGQEHPGLGQAKKVLKLMLAYCRYRKLDGLLNYPEYYHNAYLYRKVFKFYNPRKEGEFYAILRDLSALSLSAMSWAINSGCVIDKETEKTVEWQSAVQVYPITQKWQEYFKSDYYLSEYSQAFTAKSYFVEMDKLNNIYKQVKLQQKH